MKSIFVLLILAITVVSSINIDKLNQKQLAKLAIDIESYVREVKQIRLLGGLHDYAYSLSKEQLITIIEDFIRNEGRLVTDFINRKANLRKSRIEVTLEDSLIVSFLSKYSKKILFSVAAEVESLTRKRLERPILGGLHDIISEDLSEKELALAIESYVEEFKLVSVDEIIEMVMRVILIDLPKDKLVALAFKLEGNLRSKFNQFLLGGFHDYIDSLSVEEIVDAIFGLISSYGEKAKIAKSELLKLIERL